MTVPVDPYSNGNRDERVNLGTLFCTDKTAFWVHLSFGVNMMQDLKDSLYNF